MSEEGNMISKWIVSLAKLVQDLPPPHRMWAVILAMVALVVLAIYGAHLFEQGAILYSLIPFLCFFLLAAMVCYFVKLSSDRQSTGGITGQHDEASEIHCYWDRLVIAYPVDSGTLTALSESLKNLRLRAHELINKGFQSDITLNLIRANIFLANYTQASGGYVCWLEIPHSLHVNMDEDDDKNIRLRPGQGSTGKVFVEEAPHVALPVKEGDSLRQWDDKYQLTAEHERLIRPDLRWIVSLPLTIPDSTKSMHSHAAGVLNIDGLREEISREFLEDKLSPFLMVEVGREIVLKLLNLKKARLVVGIKGC
jgi:hypothetical protein